jgi:hypothetical protein
LFCSVSSNGRYCGSAGACEMGEGISLLAEKVGINVLYFEYFQVLNTFIKFLGEQKLGCYEMDSFGKKLTFEPKLIHKPLNYQEII